jgi:hypothetical protein
VEEVEEEEVEVEVEVEVEEVLRVWARVEVVEGVWRGVVVWDWMFL